MGDADRVLNETFEWPTGAVRWSRRGEGPPVVLCHGTPWSSFVWRKVASRLAATRTVYRWDMLGYGQSDQPDADVSLLEQGRILAALAAHWELESPDVVAHDFGGAVALRAHLLHGVALRSLALVDVVALRPWGSPFFRLVGEHPDVFTRLPERLHTALVREYVSGAAAHTLPVDVVDSLVAPWTGPTGQAAFYRQIAQASEQHTDEIESRLGGVRVPTLVVWGTEDAWIPVTVAHRLHAAISGSRIRLIDGAGHLVQEDRPDELSTVLAEWLDSGA